MEALCRLGHFSLCFSRAARFLLATFLIATAKSLSRLFRKSSPPGSATSVNVFLLVAWHFPVIRLLSQYLTDLRRPLFLMGSGHPSYPMDLGHLSSRMDSAPLSLARLWFQTDLGLLSFQMGSAHPLCRMA